MDYQREHDRYYSEAYNFFSNKQYKEALASIKLAIENEQEMFRILPENMKAMMGGSPDKFSQAQGLKRLIEEKMAGKR